MASQMHINHYDALIVGAGWGGIWMLHALRQKGFRCLCVEASWDVGGVWCYTEYPGCRNETETPVYQFSAKETWESWTWSERFPTKDEIHAYMRHACRTLDLYKDMVFNTPVSKAIWCATTNRWKFFSGEQIIATAQFYLPCTGYTGKKYLPELRGLKTFVHAYHTSEWPRDMSVEGKRVAVVGTGSSGLQTIETIGPHVGHLTVFQRTPNLANPRYQEFLTPESEAKEQESYAKRYADMAASPTGLEVRPIDRNTFDDSIQERMATYESLWLRGSQFFWFGNYKDLLTNPMANLEAYGFWREKVRSRLDDAAKRDLLAPMTPPHHFGTKRPSLESSYYEVYNQSNVDLVDLNVDPIDEITSKGVRMKSGRFHEVDILILATGFDFGIGSQVAIDVRGVRGISLREKWGRRDLRRNSDCSSRSTLWPSICKRFKVRDLWHERRLRRQADRNGVLTYLGMMCAGFPNMLMSLGPQAPTAFSITPRFAELQGNWVADCLDYVRGKGTTINTTKKAEFAWKRKIQQIADTTLIPGTDGWYMSNNIDGRKKEPMFWFGGVPDYMAICNESAKNGYKSGFVIR